MAETVSYVNRARSFMPEGTVPPFIMRFDAGSVPVGFLVCESATMPIGEIQFHALFKVRPIFASLPGVSAPPPFGGNQRTIVLKVRLKDLQAQGLAPGDVVKALSEGNIISPSGAITIGDTSLMVPVNSVAVNPEELLDLPLRGQDGKGPMIYLKDVGEVKDAT